MKVDIGADVRAFDAAMLAVYRKMQAQQAVHNQMAAAQAAASAAAAAQANTASAQITAFFSRAGTSIGNFMETAGKVGFFGLLAGIGAATYGIEQFIAKGIKGAMNLEESLNKVSVVFGSASGKIINLAQEMAKSFGLPKVQIIDAASLIGQIGKAANMSKVEAADFGVKMTRMAVDASSLMNVPLEEALRKIEAGLVGQSRPLRMFGVLLSAAAVEAEAMRMGLGKTHSEISEGDKVLARASLITQGLKDSYGDMANTQDSTRNAAVRFHGTIDNLATDMGTALKPATNAAMNAIADLATSMSDLVKGDGGSFKDWIKNLTSFLSAIPSMVDAAATGIQILSLQIRAAATNIAEATKVGTTAGIYKGHFVSANKESEALAAGFVGRELTRATAAKHRQEKEAMGAAVATGKEAFEGSAMGLGVLAFLDPKVRFDQDTRLKEAPRKLSAKEQKEADEKADIFYNPFNKLMGIKSHEPGQFMRETEGKTEKLFTSQSMGAADAYASMRQAIHSDKDDTAKKQLDIGAKSLEALGKIVENTKSGMAILGP